MLSALADLRRKCIASDKQSVVVAVSGGVDSAVVLTLMRLLQYHCAFSSSSSHQQSLFRTERSCYEMEAVRFNSKGGEFNPRDLRACWEWEEFTSGSRATSFDLRAVHMRNWNASAEDGSGTSGPVECMDRQEDDARDLCRRLRVPLQIVDCSTEYWERCFVPMIESVERCGLPLNPDVLCNREVKFGRLLEILDATTSSSDATAPCALATGHYALRSLDSVEGKLKSSLHPPLGILQGTDPLNDQTYFLSQLNQEKLHRALFPLGELFLSKESVRDFARTVDTVIPMGIAKKKTSTGLCFVGNRQWTPFVSQFTEPGDGEQHVHLCDVRGETLQCVESVTSGGQNFQVNQLGNLLRTATIGQKIYVKRARPVKGNGGQKHAGPRDEEVYFYVFEKDIQQKKLYLVGKETQKEEQRHVLWSSWCKVVDVVLQQELARWPVQQLDTSGHPDDTLPWSAAAGSSSLRTLRVTAACRHQEMYDPATLYWFTGDPAGEADTVLVDFDAPRRAMTTGQCIVIRVAENQSAPTVLGSGTIETFSKIPEKGSQRA